MGYLSRTIIVRERFPKFHSRHIQLEAFSMMYMYIYKREMYLYV